MNTLMERTRAVVALMNSTRYSSDTESNRRTQAFAFLTLFHPGITLAKRLMLAREIAEEARGA